MLEVEIFDICGVDFVDPFLSLRGNKYMLVPIDYVSKRVETIASPTYDAILESRFFKMAIFCTLPRVLISDKGTHFIE